MLLMEKPAKAARLCGLTRLTDTLHGRWIREMVFGQGDMTLLAHRGSYKTTCLSFAMAVMLVVYPRKNLLFLRKTDSDVLEVLRQVKLLLATDAMQELTGRHLRQPCAGAARRHVEREHGLLRRHPRCAAIAGAGHRRVDDRQARRHHPYR